MWEVSPIPKLLAGVYLCHETIDLLFPFVVSQKFVAEIQGCKFGGVGGGCHTPNSFTIRYQLLFMVLSWAWSSSEPELLMSVNSSEKSCTTKLCYSKSPILFLIPHCIEVGHIDLVSSAGPINEQCPGT